jgi:hypothetical protein
MTCTFCRKREAALVIFDSNGNTYWICLACDTALFPDSPEDPAQLKGGDG